MTPHLALYGPVPLVLPVFGCAKGADPHAKAVHPQ
jgi:hypothetical protein